MPLPRLDEAERIEIERNAASALESKTEKAGLTAQLVVVQHELLQLGEDPQRLGDGTYTRSQSSQFLTRLQ